MTASMDRYLVSVLRFDAETAERIRQAMTQIQRYQEEPITELFLPHVSLVPTDFDEHAN